MKIKEIQNISFSNKRVKKPHYKSINLTYLKNNDPSFVEVNQISFDTNDLEKPLDNAEEQESHIFSKKLDNNIDWNLILERNYVTEKEQKSSLNEKRTYLIESNKPIYISSKNISLGNISSLVNNPNMKSTITKQIFLSNNNVFYKNPSRDEYKLEESDVPLKIIKDETGNLFLLVKVKVENYFNLKEHNSPIFYEAKLNGNICINNEKIKVLKENFSSTFDLKRLYISIKSKIQDYFLQKASDFIVYYTNQNSLNKTKFSTYFTFEKSLSIILSHQKYLSFNFSIPNNYDEDINYIVNEISTFIETRKENLDLLSKSYLSKFFSANDKIQNILQILASNCQVTEIQIEVDILKGNRKKSLASNKIKIPSESSSTSGTSVKVKNTQIKESKVQASKTPKVEPLKKLNSSNKKLSELSSSEYIPSSERKNYNQNYNSYIGYNGLIGINPMVNSQMKLIPQLYYNNSLFLNEHVKSNIMLSYYGNCCNYSTIIDALVLKIYSSSDKTTNLIDLVKIYENASYFGIEASMFSGNINSKYF